MERNGLRDGEGIVDTAPQLSPLYSELPNAEVDFHGVITTKPYWNTAVKKLICGIIYCKKCGCDRLYNVIENNKICDTCGNKVGEV